MESVLHLEGVTKKRLGQQIKLSLMLVHVRRWFRFLLTSRLLPSVDSVYIRWWYPYFGCSRSRRSTKSSEALIWSGDFIWWVNRRGKQICAILKNVCQQLMNCVIHKFCSIIFSFLMWYNWLIIEIRKFFYFQTIADCSSHLDTRRGDVRTRDQVLKVVMLSFDLT